MQFDVFNGDADGVCALHQMRLASPADSILITGPKREINLLERVKAKAGDEVLVLDIALSKNRAALDRLLEDGVRVRYFDHHQPGDIPQHPAFEPHIRYQSGSMYQPAGQRLPGWPVFGLGGDRRVWRQLGLGRAAGRQAPEP